MSDKEQNLYRLIAQRYIANFYPDHRYRQKTITVSADGQPYTFKSVGRTVTVQGWQTVLKDPEPEKTEENDRQNLPDCKAGDPVAILKSGYSKLNTTPPPNFTEGTLIKAMENIYKYTDDPEIKKILKDGDGIGTSATRAGIITELKNRKFLETKGKAIISTEIGRSVIDKIPQKFKSPAMTAIFERILGKIEQGTATTADFLKSQVDEITKEISKIKDVRIKIDGVKDKNVSTVYKCTDCGGGLIRRTGKNGYWWSCENYPKCKCTYRDKSGRPDYSTKN